jgi:enterochelin esterase-like enzyme
MGVAELYRSNALGGNYAPPVHHEGHLYGFRGQILTCVNAETGERVWRSREPGGDGLILVDGSLVIFGAKGNVVVAAATPEGYVEKARLQALEGSSLTWPSFADGRIFVRNLEEMAAVEVKAGAGAVRAAGDGPVGAGTAFAAWIGKVKASDDPQAMVDAYFEKVESTPLVEGEFVHFVYRDADAADVGLAGSMNDSDALEPLERVAGTDLFHRTLELSPDSHWEYRFQVNFEDWTTDPGNPRTVPATEGGDMLSALLPADYPAATFTAEPSGPRGDMESFTLESEALGWEKEIQVWLPPGYGDGEASYPLLVVNDAEAWIDKGLLVHALDNLVGKSVQPMVVAFVNAHRAWWLEAGGSETAGYVAMLATELVPELKKRYRLADTPGGHAILGHRFYAFSSAYAALEHPEIFGKVGMQSAYTGLGLADELMAKIAAGEPGAVDFYLDWNRYDERNIDRDWDFARDSRTLDQALRARGYDVAGGELEDSYGWAGWRTRIDDILSALYPLSGQTAGGGR